MKAFKEWWNEERSLEEVTAELGAISNQDDFVNALAKLSWRAALEFILAQETIKPLLGGGEHRYIDSIVIRKELEK